MNTRTQILERVKKAKPEFVPLEDLDTLLQTDGQNSEEEYVSIFADMLRNLKAQVIDVNSEQEVEDQLTSLFDLNDRAVINGLTCTHIVEDLDTLYLFVARGSLGVAENGAIWVEKRNLPRGLAVLTFVCEHLVLVLNKARIVPDMHDAYKAIPKHDIGYGVFISGPSKTADIEQSLVIGAHGPKSLTVFIVNEKINNE